MDLGPLLATAGTPRKAATAGSRAELPHQSRIPRAADAPPLTSGRRGSALPRRSPEPPMHRHSRRCEEEGAACTRLPSGDGGEERRRRRLLVERERWRREMQKRGEQAAAWVKNKG